MYTFLDQGKMTPQIAVSRTGRPVTFVCDSAAGTSPRWFFNNGPVPKNVIMTKNILEIRKVKKYNSGVYECLGKHNRAPYPLFSASATLHIKSKLY